MLHTTKPRQRGWTAKPRWGVAGVAAVAAVLVTLVVQRDGPVAGEMGITRWLHNHTPGPVSDVGAVLDPLITDLSAPLLFAAIVLAVWWRWGRPAAVLMCLAGGLTALVRIGDLAKRPRPTSQIEWTTYTFGDGGYPSGHVVFTVLILGGVVVAARRHASPAVARRLAGLTIVLVAVTCWTRVSRLEHWPLDVVGGLLMGIAGLAVVASIAVVVEPATRRHPRLRLLVGLEPVEHQ